MRRDRWTTMVFVALFAITAGAIAGQGPHIHAPEMKHDFGMVKAGDRPEHLFEIRNVGDDVLVIQKVQSS